MGFRKLFLILLAIVTCYGVEIQYFRELWHLKDVREVEILDVSMMGRWTTFVDKHGDGIKNPFRDQWV